MMTMVTVVTMMTMVTMVMVSKLLVGLRISFWQKILHYDGESDYVNFDCDNNHSYQGVPMIIDSRV